jgi:tRNA (guanine37-N1)-methyltransferase
MTTKKAKAVCAPLAEAEFLRKTLREWNLLRDDVQMVKEGKYIFFPVKDVPDALNNYKIVTKSFELKVLKPHSYKELLKIPKKLLKELPTSYDVVGAIILIKLPKALFPYQKEIGTALLETHKNIRTVCLIDPVSGELRTRNVSIIAGENKMTTTHTEYGLSFNVNVETTYFSPRLASERKRVADLVKSGEVVVDLFAGVAPFSVMIARFAQPRIIYAIDKNREAIKLAEQNVKQNHVLEKVEIIHADAKDAEKVIPVKADRIIMNLPFSAHRFFSVALSIAAQTCIEFYIGLDITATKTPT